MHFPVWLKSLLISVGIFAVGVVLVALFLFCGLLKCSQYVREELTPADVVSLPGLKAKIKHREFCWESCRDTAEIRFITGFKTLGEDFFRHEIGLPWQPLTSGVIAFPKKSMLLTEFSDEAGGSVIVGISVASGKAHVIPIMGCIQIDYSTTFSSEPARPGYRCARDTSFYWSPATFVKSLQVSYHHQAWIDYQTQTFHPIAANTPFENFLSVIGIDEQRNNLFVLFEHMDNENYLLCAYGHSGIKATYRCDEFRAETPAPKRNDTHTISAQDIPLPTSNIKYISENIDPSIIKEWLSAYFVIPTDSAAFIPRATTKIIRSDQGTKPSSLEN